MATQLDLQEQEQLDALKAFWNRYGTFVTWALIAVLGAYAAWTGWQWWQREQAVKAGAMYDELERAAQGGDVQRAGRIFADLKQRYPRTAFAEQGALMAAKSQFEGGQSDAARATLTWAAENAAQSELRTVARLRLAGVLADAQQYDAALLQLDAARGDASFEGLVADRRGDVLLAQGQTAPARAAYEAAYRALDDRVGYRRIVEAKLTAAGGVPGSAATASGGASAAASAVAAPVAAVQPKASGAAPAAPTASAAP